MVRSHLASRLVPFQAIAQNRHTQKHTLEFSRRVFSQDVENVVMPVCPVLRSPTAQPDIFAVISEKIGKLYFLKCHASFCVTGVTHF